MVENFESIVKEIDEMLMFREIDKLIKKHEKKISKFNQKHEFKEEKTDLKCQVNIRKNNQDKVEIFELPVRKVRRTIEVTY